MQWRAGLCCVSAPRRVLFPICPLLQPCPCISASLSLGPTPSPLVIDLNKEFSSFQVRAKGSNFLFFPDAHSVQELSSVKYLRKACLSDGDLRRFKELFLLAVDRNPHNDIMTKHISALDLETQALLYSENYWLLVEDWDERPAPGKEEEEREYEVLLKEAFEYGVPPVPVYEANLQQFFDPR